MRTNSNQWLASVESWKHERGGITFRAIELYRERGWLVWWSGCCNYYLQCNNPSPGYASPSGRRCRRVGFCAAKKGPADWRDLNWCAWHSHSLGILLHMRKFLKYDQNYDYVQLRNTRSTTIGDWFQLQKSKSSLSPTLRLVTAVSGRKTASARLRSTIAKSSVLLKVGFSLSIGSLSIPNGGQQKKKKKKTLTVTNFWFVIARVSQKGDWNLWTHFCWLPLLYYTSWFGERENCQKWTSIMTLSHNITTHSAQVQHLPKLTLMEPRMLIVFGERIFCP